MTLLAKRTQFAVNLRLPPKGVKRGIQIICVPYFTGLPKKICVSKDFWEEEEPPRTSGVLR